MLAATESLADFSRWCAPPIIANTIRLTHPPHNSRSDARECQPQQVQTGPVMCYLPRSFDQAKRGLRHELVYVVDVAILHAWVDTATPRGPLPIADPALAEGCHPSGRPVQGIASVEDVSEVVVLNLDRVAALWRLSKLTGCDRTRRGYGLVNSGRIKTSYSQTVWANRSTLATCTTASTNRS